MNIKKIIKQHCLWLDTRGKRGSCANLSGRDLRGLDFSGVNLSYANLEEANCEGTNWAGADLEEATLDGSSFRCANLSSANLCGASARNTYFFGADMSFANLNRANFHNANLNVSSLYKASLWGTRGNLRQIKSVFCDKYAIAYTSEILQIGCERHKIEEWWEFDEEHIEEMDGEEAIFWWREWKPILQQIIQVSPALPI